MRRLLGAMVVLVALAGCATVPVEGPVRSAPIDLKPGDDVHVPAAPDPPKRGDPPEQILEGFLAAMATYQQDFSVAREYIASDEQSAWRPSGIRVHEASIPRPFDQKTKTLRLRTGWLGTVGADGGWYPAKRGTALSYDFLFVQDRGEWRIANPPDYLLVSETSFMTEYVAYDLYFWDPAFTHLVPDPVYLPFRGNTATLLVQALLDGPTAWMEPAVRSMFPRGTQLTAQSVPVVDNTATVDLDAGVRDVTPRERELMAAQLTWTLGQVRDLERVQILSERKALQITEDQPASSLQPLDNPPDKGPDVRHPPTNAYALRGDRVVQISPDDTEDSVEATPVRGVLGNGQVPVGSLAVSLQNISMDPGARQSSVNADQFAVVSPNGREVRILSPRVDEWRKDPDQIYSATTAPVYEGTSVLEPSWDRNGLVWLVDRLAGGGTRFVVFDPVTGKSKEVPVSALPGQVQAFKVSRDGIRVAALVRVGKENQLMVGWINRTDQLAIGGLRELPLELTELTDLAWASVDEVVVVGRANGVPAIWRVGMDGHRVIPTTPPDAARPMTVAAAPGRQLLVGAIGGMLYREDPDGGWHAVEGSGESPVYPG